MKQKLLIFIVAVSIMLINTSVFALQKAEIDPYDPSISYGVQTLNNELIALNLEGDVGLSSNFGLEGMVTYYQDEGSSAENTTVLDLNTKLSIVDDPDLNLSALLGYHTKLEKNAEGYPRVGLLISKRENSELDLNVGLDFLLGTGQTKNYLGYTLGLDYKLTPDLYLEVEHRRFAGQEDTEGLNLGIRYYL